MYLNGQLEDKIEQYVSFFDRNWKLLLEALIELGYEPDSLKLQGRIRSLATILQLTTITLDYLERQRCNPLSHQLEQADVVISF